jgi:hypothetical protein
MRYLVIALLAALPVVATPPAAAPTTQRAYAHFYPDHDDDLAWENERIAFRVFGPGSEKLGVKTGSGVDVWAKSTSNLILDRWYAAGNYKEDHGEGLDFYGVGTSRGCGGLGIWNGKALECSRTFAKAKVLEAGPDHVAFEINYAAWTVAGGRKVWESRRITFNAGSSLYRATSTIFSDDPSPLAVGIGVARRSGDGGELTRDKRRAILAYWQPPDPDHGSIAVGLLINPGEFQGFEAMSDDYLAVVKVTPSRPFTYYAGAAWSKRGDVRDAEAWFAYLRAFGAKFENEK